VGMESLQFANDADIRERQQAYVTPAFSHSAIQDYYSVFARLTEETIKRIKREGKDGKVGVNIRPLTMELATKSITATSFGKEFSPEDVSHFMIAYDFLNTDFETRLSGSMPAPGSEREKLFLQHQDWMKKKASDICTRKKAQRNKSGEEKDKKKEGSDYRGFIDYLIDADASDERTFSEILSFAIGGSHTTGNALSWASIYLAQHPQVMKKCQEELKEVIGDRSCAEFKDLDKLKYLKQVVDETLRCSVLAPWAGRYSNEEIKIDSYLLPPKTPLILALGVVLQDENIWTNPTQFNPDRFNEENNKIRHGLAFQPFGFAGKRVCPGMKYANVELMVVLSGFLQAFDITLVKPQEKIEQVFGLVTKPKEDVYLFFNSRK